MPLFRIETRPKTPPPSRPTGPVKERPDVAGARARPARRGAGVPALVAGVLAGLVLVAGASAFLIARSRSTATNPGSAVPNAPGAPVGASLAGGPINADYPREATIAYVDGEPYTMAQLETAVRVARTLATLTGDAAPAYGSPDMKAYQVGLLKRQIDMVLMRQAVARDGLAPPEGPVDDLIQSFLGRVGATPERLDAELAANGITRAELTRWFEDSRTTNFYVQQTLMNGQDQAQRDTIVRQWLDAKWAELQDQNRLLINFYDPATLNLPPAAPAGVSP